MAVRRYLLTAIFLIVTFKKLNMRTILFTISYDGTAFVGWQRQPNGISVQELIEDALARMTGRRTCLTAAGRTDAGVHALAQVASFTTSSSIPCNGLVSGLNSMLPDEISILSALEVSSGFNARRDAAGKIYRYRILHSQLRAPLLEKRCWHVRGLLDLSAMKVAARAFVGEHDFESFKAAGCGSKDARRRLCRIKFRSIAARDEPMAGPIDGRIIEIDFEGDAFVRHMIRNIVGTLVDVGQEKMAGGDMHRVLSARKREKAGRCAPACGLYLVKVLL
jgi:tRNA pseudouridine38-40 synthase